MRLSLFSDELWLKDTQKGNGKGKGKGKGKIHPRISHEGPEGQKIYSSTLSLTSALDGVGVQRHSSTALAPRDTVLILQRAGWAPAPVRTGA